MYLDYIKDRYTAKDFAPFTPEEVAEKFEELQKALGNEIMKTKNGFFTYRLQGDAMIIDDMFVKRESRQAGEAWKLHSLMLKIATLMKKRVMIGFSEHGGHNKHLGTQAMSAAGFIPAFEEKDRTVFIKGI